MTRYFNTTLLITIALGACALTGSVAAAPACAPGLENVAGTCVTAGLAASMRERGVLMNQLKIGYNLPIAPRKDNLYPKNFDVNRFEFSQPGNFSTNPFPPSP
ncbi:hypothetical protein ACFFWD_18195 [Bradyrhizobium erythrophlei]|uniref:hypothetical protein n=1 Tax=Bradyrhizobium erythrophlei TaxID=1437360 RepID=UPI0035ECEBAA